MSFFKRLTNIIKSNINYGRGIDFGNNINVDDIDINSYDDTLYKDINNVSSENNIEKEYYAILELEYGAGFDKIKSSYKRLLKKYHPDLYHNEPNKLKTAQKLTEKINEAYSYFERKYQ